MDAKARHSLMKSLSLTLVALFPVVLGCETPDAPGRAADDVVDGRCDLALRYDVMFAQPGHCGRAVGAWTPRTLFTPLSSVACSFEWTGSRPPSAASSELLEQHVAAAGGAMTANCSGGAPASGTAEIFEGPPPTPAHPGCDVCRALAFVASNELFAVVPPDTGFWLLNVARSDGVSVRMTVSGGQTPGPFRAKLPAPPAGTHWLEGPVSVF
jgi:hypothetical protein